MKPRFYIGEAWNYADGGVPVVVAVGHPDHAEPALLSASDLFALRAQCGALLLDAPAHELRVAVVNHPASSVCDVCGHESARTLPSHFPKCPTAAAWSVRVIARAMEALDVRIRKLEGMAGELRGLGEDGELEAVSLQLAADNRRREWWGWAERLVGKPQSEMSAADIRALAVRAEAERNRDRE